MYGGCSGPMKSKFMVGALVFSLIALILGFSLYYSILVNPEGSGEDQTDNPDSPDSVGQLKINYLTASSDGTVSFNVTLYDSDSGAIETVIINGESYLWSEGSSDDGALLKGETKSWSKNIGDLQAGSEVEVTLQASPGEASGSVIVDGSTGPDEPDEPDVTPDVPDEPDVPSPTEYFYDYYSSVGLFERGVYFVATSEDPLTQLPRSDLPKSYWELMHDKVAVEATDQDFISMLLCRGDFPTGGYTLAVEAFSWLESYPVKFRFQVNFTDPGEGVAVTQAFTNPALLVPIGKLTPGEYKVEIHIVSYILTFDEHGEPVYTPIMTFKEEVWSETLTITSSQAPTPSTTFKVEVNNNPFSDLTLPVGLSTGVTQEKAELIAKATFVHVKGEATLFRLDDLTFTDEEITARFTWGVDENDMMHIFELTADLTNLAITVNHCF
jgi:hypothetical protein